MVSTLPSLLHLSAPQAAAATPAPRPRGRGQRICQQCGTANTAQWRYAHNGSFLMCNACGIRWRRKNSAHNNNNSNNSSRSALGTRIHKPTYNYTNNHKYNHNINYGYQSLVLPPLRADNFVHFQVNTTTTTNYNDTTTYRKKPITLPPLTFDKPRATSPISIRSLLNDVPISPAYPSASVPFMFT